MRQSVMPAPQNMFHLFRLLYVGFCLVLFICCQGKSPVQVAPQEDSLRIEEDVLTDTVIVAVPQKSVTALHFDTLGLVDVQTLDPSIRVSLVYATADNFTGHILYDDLREAYLHPHTAEALLMAQRLLKEEFPTYTLLILDATRPFSVQQKMWQLVRNTPKHIYVSNPSRGGGLHNYGLAVDLTIADEDGRALPMGTPFDYFGAEAHITQEAQLVEQGLISVEEKNNRELLRKVMRGAGFRALPTEWWHFNLHSRDTAKAQYQLIE